MDKCDVVGFQFFCWGPAGRAEATRHIMFLQAGQFIWGESSAPRPALDSKGVILSVLSCLSHRTEVKNTECGQKLTMEAVKKLQMISEEEQEPRETQQKPEPADNKRRKHKLWAYKL